VLLARDIEAHGPLPAKELTTLEYRLRGEKGYRLWLRAIAAGDHISLYRWAAARAIRSPDVRRRLLGGRSNTLTVEDHLGLSTDTFVFKQTTARRAELELNRAAVIEEELVRRGLAGEFGLVDHITVLEEGPPSADDLRTVMTVRRFARGSMLSDVAEQSAAVQTAQLTRAGRFLAYIHAVECGAHRQPMHVHKELKTKEVGRWLKAIADIPGDRSFFARWWDGVRSLKALPRRDAHAFNWIVTDNDRILAVDLEAVGWRPVGYELAQLTDDVAILPCTDEGWAQRLAILDVYGAVLAERGVVVGADDLLQGYVGGLIARAVRALSDPEGSRSRRAHGNDLLHLVARVAPDETARQLTEDILQLWARRLGAVQGTTIPERTDARRRQISRTLAYHLRHSTTIRRDRAGWASVEMLTDQLRADGLKVSTMDILAVASAIDENRFEIADSHIRAMYGHTVPVDIDYVSSAERPRLFHATPMQAVDSIFQRYGGGGLQPMARQWVHLATDWRRAMRTGERRGSAVLLSLAPDQEETGTFHHAGGVVWLTAGVASSALTIVPIYTIFDWSMNSA
jgi:RNA:NAD 2'-phosphotransferase (TPT1/KptA family)